MQSQNRTGARHVQSTGYQNRSSRPKKKKMRPEILLSVLCALLPPVGILCTWRARRISLTMRIASSLLGTASMILIFIWLMGVNQGSASSIRPIPSTPTTVGYGSVNDQTVVLPAQGGLSDGNVAPAQPSVNEPVAQDQGMDSALLSNEPDELGPESIVYAVTNNAVSYHRFEVCGTQTNNRSLTLQQALMEGLIPCENCIGSGISG